SPHCTVSCAVFSLSVRPPPGSTLFPYTTLFRSWGRQTDPPGPALPRGKRAAWRGDVRPVPVPLICRWRGGSPRRVRPPVAQLARDRKSTRLNSSHVKISYAVFCLKKKKESKLH